MPRRRWNFALFLLAAALPALSSCGKDALSNPDEELALLVGDWDATRFVVQSKSNPQTAPDLITAIGASFTLHIEPSGQYTAILTYEGNALPEIGLLELDGSDVIFHVTHPAKSTSRSRLTTPGVGKITLVGDTEFTFVPGNGPQPAVATIDLKKR